MDTIQARARTKASDDECATGLRFKNTFHSSQDTASGPKLTESGRHNVEVGLYWTFCRRDTLLNRVVNAEKYCPQMQLQSLEMISHSLNQQTVLSLSRRWMQSWKQMLAKTRKLLDFPNFACCNQVSLKWSFSGRHFFAISVTSSPSAIVYPGFIVSWDCSAISVGKSQKANTFWKCKKRAGVCQIGK